MAGGAAGRPMRRGPVARAFPTTRIFKTMKNTQQGNSLPLEKWVNEYWEVPIRFKPAVTARRLGAIMPVWFREKLKRANPPAHCDPQPLHPNRRRNARRLTGELWSLRKTAMGGIL